MVTGSCTGGGATLLIGDGTVAGPVYVLLYIVVVVLVLVVVVAVFSVEEAGDSYARKISLLPS